MPRACARALRFAAAGPLPSCVADTLARDAIAVRSTVELAYRVPAHVGISVTSTWALTPTRITHALARGAVAMSAALVLIAWHPTRAMLRLAGLPVPHFIALARTQLTAPISVGPASLGPARRCPRCVRCAHCGWLLLRWAWASLAHTYCRVGIAVASKGATIDAPGKLHAVTSLALVPVVAVAFPILADAVGTALRRACLPIVARVAHPALVALACTRDGAVIAVHAARARGTIRASIILLACAAAIDALAVVAAVVGASP